jgi:hypothetical protein
LEPDITDPDDLGVNDVDVDDQLLLFDGNAHPPEYYRNGIENFNEVDIENGDYALGPRNYLMRSKTHGRGLIANRDDINLVLANGICRFCFSVRQLRGDCLARQGFEAISVGILKNLFDWFIN